MPKTVIWWCFPRNMKICFLICCPFLEYSEIIECMAVWRMKFYEINAVWLLKSSWLHLNEKWWIEFRLLFSLIPSFWKQFSTLQWCLHWPEIFFNWIFSLDTFQMLSPFLLLPPQKHYFISLSLLKWNIYISFMPISCSFYCYSPSTAWDKEWCFPSSFVVQDCLSYTIYFAFHWKFNILSFQVLQRIVLTFWWDCF